MSRHGILVFSFLGLYSVMADQMEAPKVNRESFQVVGIQVRTTNAQEMTGNGAIPKLWGRFRREGLLEKIPNRVGSDTIVLNTDYQSDKNGEYTYVLGAKVSSAHEVPVGMGIHEVPAGEYARFSAREESSPAVVVGLWQHIWSLEDSGHLARVYKTDYEVHHGSQNAKANVEIYIGIKE